MQLDPSTLEARRTDALNLIRSEPRLALERLIAADPLRLRQLLGRELMQQGVCDSSYEAAAEIYASLIHDRALEGDLRTWLPAALEQRVARAGNRELSPSAVAALERAIGSDATLARAFWGNIRSVGATKPVLMYMACRSAAVRTLLELEEDDQLLSISEVERDHAEACRREALAVAWRESRRGLR